MWLRYASPARDLGGFGRLLSVAPAGHAAQAHFPIALGTVGIGTAYKTLENARQSAYGARGEARASGPERYLGVP
jgi:hypothetical protein